MNTNYASELSKIFGGCDVKNTDWTQPRKFDSTENDCYAAEAALLSELTSEAYNSFGFEVLYYVKNINTKIDKLYGEDPLENVERRFKLQMYVESIPTMQKQYDLQGMIYNELITCQCTIQHFYEASQLSYPDLNNIYEGIEPLIGDIIYIEYSDTYYELVNVKKFAEQTTFLSTPITYTFILRQWRNNHDTVDIDNKNADNMSEIRNFEELAETFNMELTDTNKHVISNISNESDILSEKLPDISHIPSDNIKKHTKYKEQKIIDENNNYIDPFEGW